MSQGKYGEKRDEYKTNYKYAIIIKVNDMSQYKTQKVILKKYIILQFISAHIQGVSQ